MLTMQVYQPHSVGMMHEYSTCELLARAAVIHHDDEGHNALKHYAALTGLSAVVVQLSSSGSYL